MKKVLKRVSVVALSALMVGGMAATLAGCGDENLISVYVFAGDDDQQTNTDLIEAWAEEYSAKLVASGEKPEGWSIKTKCYFDNDTPTYFDSLIKAINAGSAQDVFYVSPKYVKAWATKGRVVELSQYLGSVTSGANPAEVYSQALGLYAYDGTRVGDPVTYNSTTGKFTNDVTGKETGIYAFPKDYSTFGLAYNAVYFTDAKKETYNTTKALSTDKTSDGKSIIRVASTGADANIINIGVPTTYFPYNFYRFDSYEEALAAGDPVAQFSDMNGGYTVTLPGYPGETYTRTNYDTTTAYDDSIGYITYTYAEYGAITWALTYYYNQIAGSETTIYGNDQYEGTLYLLPWLAGNNADYINAEEGTSSDGTKVDAYTSVRSGTYTRTDGTVINYGIDNEEFIETYAAFAAYGSDWNGNSYYCGDEVKPGGYAQFKAGNTIFYGVGTWDAAGFNGVSESTLVYRVMPEPVSEDYALYSRVKDAQYESRVYTNGSSSLSTSDSTAVSSYSDSDIISNQETRQSAWAGRVDSVGYGVNGDVLDDEEWKVKACVDLAAAMTLNKDNQLSLTYAGSQLPNFPELVADYVGDSTTHQPDGAFSDAITPDSDEWDTYYELQAELVKNTDSKTTLKEYMAAKHPNLKYNTAYGDYTLKRISTNIRAYLCLNMLALDYNSRNLCLRMVEGVNGVADSCSYTYKSAWIDIFATYKATSLQAYTQKIEQEGGFEYTNDPSKVDGGTLCTPYAYCKHYVDEVQLSLDDSVATEKQVLTTGIDNSVEDDAS